MQERKLRVRDSMEIEHPGGNATVHKAMVGIRARFKIDLDNGTDLKARGNLSTTSTRWNVMATRWPRSRRGGSAFGTPTVWRSPLDEDAALILAITVCIDELTRD